MTASLSTFRCFREGLGLALFLFCAHLPPCRLGAAPLPPEIAGWSEETKAAQRVAGRELLSRIAAEVAAGSKAVEIPRGDYRFADNTGGRHPAHIVLPKGMEGVTLDFHGSTLWFETEASGILLRGARRCTLKNVFLDWDPLPFLQGRVVALQPEAGTFDVRLDPGYEKGSPPLMKESWRGRAVFFDSDSRELKRGQVGCEVSFSRAPDEQENYRLRYHGFHGTPLARSGIAAGDPVALLLRMQRAVRLEFCDDCVLEDVTLYAAPFIGFVHSAGGGAVFRRCHIVRRPGTDRLIAGNADGINCDNMTRGPLIESCRIEWIADDFVNVHGHLGRVIVQESPDELIVTRMNRRAVVKEPVEVEFLERATLRSLGRRSATWTGVDWKVDASRCLADLGHKWHSGDAAALADGRTVAAVRMKLDRPLAIGGDTIVACEAFSGSGAVIRDNEFRGSLARGLRLQSPQVLVERNRVSLTMGAGLSLTGHASYWGEGPYVHNAVVRGNVFADNMVSGEAAGGQAAIFVQEQGARGPVSGLIREIRLEGNRIVDPAGEAIVARGVDGLTILNNRIVGHGARQAAPAAIRLDANTRLLLEGNEARDPGPRGGRRRSGATEGSSDGASRRRGRLPWARDARSVPLIYEATFLERERGAGGFGQGHAAALDERERGRRGLPAGDEVPPGRRGACVMAR